MNIILVSSRLKTAKTLHVTPRFLLWAVLGLIFLSFVSSFAFSWVGIRFNLPFASDLVAMVQQQHNKKNEEYLRENVSAMAVKLGEMQAQVVRLDSLGERISKLSGVALPKTDVGNKGGKDAAGGKGGPRHGGLFGHGFQLFLDPFLRSEFLGLQVAQARAHQLHEGVQVGAVELAVAQIACHHRQPGSA